MRKVLHVIVIPILMLVGSTYGQTVFNPNDPIVTYDSTKPPVTPPPNTIAKWVRTPHPKVTWNTSKFKSYYYNGIAFRMRFPTSYDPNNPSKKYPVLLFFHGGGEIGPVTDNEFHLLLGAQQFETMMNNGQFDAFMIFPQARNIAWEAWQFSTMNNIIDTLVRYHNADLDRVITMGLSIGGYGSLSYSNTHPMRAAVSIPSSPAFISVFNSQVDNFIHVPTWVGSGSQDNNPDPWQVSSFVNSFSSKGGDVKSSVYNVGHTSWDFQWKEPDLVKYWKNAHKANPIVFFQKQQIHPDSPINTRLGISAGYYEYEWQRDGITIATASNGTRTIIDQTSVASFTGNEITIKSYGIYQVRFRRSSGDAWSVWSPNPVVITANPIARAFDKNITLPYSEVLDGRKSTAVAGSTIVKYKWTKVSGPASYSLVTPEESTTWINSVTKGIYVFRLTVTDEKGRTGSTDITVTVNDGTVNQAPVANAGGNKTITLPANSVTLDGSGSTAGPGLSISSYTWSKVSGPSSSTIVSPNAATTAINNLTEGVYVFRLTVVDNTGSSSTADVSVTVNAAAVTQPVARAGNNQTITLPTNTVNLDGTASTAPTGATLVAYDWSKVSGPAQHTIASPTSAVTAVNNLAEGIYIFRLTVRDNNNATATSDVTITVNALGSAVPVANAGNDQTLPVGQSTVLNGQNSTPPPGGTIVSYRWTKYSGPTTFNIVSPNESATWLNSMVAGTYVFRLTVTDNAGKTATDDVSIIVKSSMSEPTTAIAGANQSISLPANSVTLDGSSSTPASGAVITGFNWSKVSGPASFSITSPNSASTTVTNLEAGIYIFRLLVTDDKGATSTADVTITVYSSGAGVPVANAGKDQTLPVGQSTVLDGQASSSPNGSIVKYQWSKASGPSSYNFVSPTSSSTWLNSMVAGTYVFRLTVTDNVGKVATDDVVINVFAKTEQSASTRNQPLTANEPGLDAQLFTIYPNPATDVLNIRWTSPYVGNAVLNVFDLSGRQVITQRIRKEQNDFNDRININNLRKGVYYLDIRLPDGKTGIQRTFQK